MTDPRRLGKAVPVISPRPPARRRQRRARSRGASLVEFAFVFPVLILILAGTIDYGLVLLDTNSTRQGLREGTRQAVVGNFGSDGSCTLAGGSGFGDETARALCLTKDRIGIEPSKVRLKLLFPGMNQVGNSLVLCVQYPMSSTTGLLSPVLDGRVFTGKTEMRIEKADTSLTPAAESPLPGQNWAWCT